MTNQELELQGSGGSVIVNTTGEKTFLYKINAIVVYDDTTEIDSLKDEHGNNLINSAAGNIYNYDSVALPVGFIIKARQGSWFTKMTLGVAGFVECFPMLEKGQPVRI